MTFAGGHVYEIKKAFIAKFKQVEGVKADELQLFKLEGSSISSRRTLLDPTATLAEAGIHACTKLVVEHVCTGMIFEDNGKVGGYWRAGVSVSMPSHLLDFEP